jgi:hypothetical protein
MNYGPQMPAKYIQHVRHYAKSDIWQVYDNNTSELDGYVVSFGVQRIEPHIFESHDDAMRYLITLQ